MYASNSALLNALSQEKISFKQVLSFIEARYDFTPTAFTNGTQNNAARENQGSCKVFSFAQLNHFNQLDTLALFAEHYHAVRDNPTGTDHQNIRQFIHNGWQGIHFEGQALIPKANIDEINRQVAQAYAMGSSEFAQTQSTQDPQPTENQPGAMPIPNPSSPELVENTQNLSEPSNVTDTDGGTDALSQPLTQQSTQPSEQAVNTVVDTAPVNTASVEAVSVEAISVEPTPTHEQVMADADNPLSASSTSSATHAHQHFDEKAEQAIAAAEAANSAEKMIPPAPGSSNTMATETTYLHDNDSVTAGTASADIDAAVPLTSSDTSTLAEHHSLTPTAQPDSGISASELVEANATHIANNPAAFIEEQNTSTDSHEPATTVSQESTPTDTAQSQVVANNIVENNVMASSAGTKNADTSNANTLATTSASELAHANANHMADNPAAFIEEKNTNTDNSEPASDRVNSNDVVASHATTDQSATQATDTENATTLSTLGTASASELVHDNAAHAADNHAAFIEEKNTNTDTDTETASSNAPATDAAVDHHGQTPIVAKPPIV